ncbi:glycosyltransferase family 1 protein [Paludibacter sp.]|uniref:glycosyltransferase n=1 Tax=Paludibacter sp. TaxID=1898105 RepID=UPI0013554EFE|nr:glycosyltransferase family 1 protein [Paludibacter sp.]MTK52589.1 glycosyltransferase family 4 protein [Paludibacter sp.]
MTKIILDPATNVYYSSFYIQGLIDYYGKSSIEFNNLPYTHFKSRGNNFNCIIIEHKQEFKISIDFDDFPSINDECYEWCDRYGKVNTNWKQTPKNEYPKLISLVPSFGIRVWDLANTSQLAIFNALKSRLDISKARKLLGRYKRQYHLRLPLQFYQKPLKTADTPYIFHMSTLWYSDQWNNNDEGVNLTRANFIRACIKMHLVNFEGGLIPQNKNRSSVNLFSDVIWNREIPITEYIQKTKESWIVFNTPAFWNCHGWKLGEYLALGKAIISTPLSNDLPVPLIHGENIHIINNGSKEEIIQAISLLICNDDYRHKLESGARLYWEKYGSPVESLKLLGI